MVILLKFKNIMAVKLVKFKFLFKIYLIVTILKCIVIINHWHKLVTVSSAILTGWSLERIGKITKLCLWWDSQQKIKKYNHTALILSYHHFSYKANPFQLMVTETMTTKVRSRLTIFYKSAIWKWNYKTIFFLTISGFTFSILSSL